MLDLLFLHQSFFSELPESVVQFCQSIHSLFPIIYDTKHMMKSRMALRSLFTEDTVNLGTCYSTVMHEDFKLMQEIKIDPNFTEYSLDLSDSRNKSHEAGFDALMTGILWMKMQTLLLGETGHRPAEFSVNDFIAKPLKYKQLQKQ